MGIKIYGGAEMFNGSNYNRDLRLRDIAKLVREQFKKEFPQCKFSVKTEYFSMGQALHVALMRAPFEIYLDKNERGYSQINKNSFNCSYEEGYVNNGSKLTKNGFNVLKRMCNIVESYNREDSDSQTDYFDVNFYTHFSIGNFEKPFSVSEGGLK